MPASPSSKRVLIDKTNRSIVIYVGVAAFIVVFSLVATKTLLSQAAYQNRIISAKRTAVNQLKADIASTAQLKNSYDAFISTPQNVLGGNPSGSQPQDGNNAKIVLDALPSSYDFPGLTTSLETLMSSQGVQINSISGNDDEVAQSANQTSSSPQPVPIPFQVSITGSYDNVQKVVSAFGASIRPIQIQTLSLSGSQQSITMSIAAQTFYQPAKSLSINEKVIR